MQTTTAAADTITRITLERNCFGCPGASVLVLQRDGSATLTTMGNARRGTQDQVSTGRLRAEEFGALARLALDQGFFALNDRYADPQLQDGAWATLTITRDGQDKAVFRREDAAPPALQALEAAIHALQARVAFTPSGHPPR